MKIPQTIEMQVGALNTSEHNPRQITEDDFAELVKSLLLLPKGLYYRPRRRGRPEYRPCRKYAPTGAEIHP